MGLQSKFAVIMTALTLTLAGCASDSPPNATPVPGPTMEAELQAFVDALKPTRRKVPVIAVLALNEGTETTDFLVPHAVLQRAGVASVLAVAPRAGRVTLMPALEVELRNDIADFDRTYPEGADYLIVPAMHADDDPAILGWIRAQAGKGAMVIAICSGALVVGKAGLLDGRRFTGHWYDRSTLLQRHPTATYVADRRYLADRGVATTTGIPASIPVSLALVEAIGGHARATALAEELGIASWVPEHVSAPFRLSAGKVWTYVTNSVAFWRREELGIQARDGVDDVQLALAADAWSRTHRSSVFAVADTAAPVRMRSGLALIPTPVGTTKAGMRSLTVPAQLKPALQLDRTLCEIGQRYGAPTRDWVALEMEHRVSECPAP
jgi:putative intracellular protease/amidase